MSNYEFLLIYRQLFNLQKWSTTLKKVLQKQYTCITLVIVHLRKLSEILFQNKRQFQSFRYRSDAINIEATIPLYMQNSSTKGEIK